VSATDTTAPSVEVTQPTASSYLCCSVKLTAQALDNLGVSSVQFQVDGNPVGPEIAEDPFATVWDTTGFTQGQHVITAVAKDAAGNSRTSADVTINLSQMDVQIENGSGNLPGKPDNGDSITFSYGRPINPGTVALGWSGAMPASCAPPAPPGCVSVGILADDRYSAHSYDSVAIYKDPERLATDPLNQKLTSLGSISLAVDTYVGATQTFIRSPMELVNGGTAVRITLGSGSVAAAAGAGVGTMRWSASSEVRDTANTPFCINCTVLESIVPWIDPVGGGTINDEDREF
jgi:hypothetical protein